MIFWLLLRLTASLFWTKLPSWWLSSGPRDDTLGLPSVPGTSRWPVFFGPEEVSVCSLLRLCGIFLTLPLPAPAFVLWDLSWLCCIAVECACSCTPWLYFCSCVGFKAFDLKWTKCHWDYLLPVVSESVRVKLVELVLVCCNNIVVSAPVHGLSPRSLLRLKSGLFLFIGCFCSCLFLFTLLYSFLQEAQMLLKTSLRAQKGGDLGWSL